MPAERLSWKVQAQEFLTSPGTTAPLTFGQISASIYDVLGRPLIESNDSPNPAKVKARMRTAPISGGRKGLKANGDAYKAVEGSFIRSLDLVSFLRDKIIPYNQPIISEDIQRVINAVIGLPYWLVNKSDNPIQNGEVPAFVTGATKATRGVNTPYLVYEREWYDPSEPSQLPHATEDELTKTNPFVNFVFENQLLVSKIERGRACPATKPPIRALARVLFDESTENVEGIGRELHLSENEDEDIRRIMDFGYAFIMATNERGFLLSSITESQDNARAYLEGEPVMKEVGEDEEIVEVVTRYMAQMDRSQRLMNESLGRAMPPPLTPEEAINEFRGVAEIILLLP